MGTGPGILLAPFPYGLSSSFHPLSIPPSSTRECRPSLSLLFSPSLVSNLAAVALPKLGCIFPSRLRGSLD